MINKFRSETGSYTIEACVSLVFFLVAIMFIYSQIKALIAESIIQNAVNSMAKETASYVYKRRDGQLYGSDVRYVYG